MIPQNSSHICIFDQNNRVLLVKRADNDVWCPGLWSIPGGRRKINETIWQNIVRETKEEVNLVIFPEKILFCQEISEKLNHIFFTTQYFLGKIRLDRENSSFIWLEPDKIDEKLSVPHLREEVFSCLKVLNQPKMFIRVNK